MDAIICIDNEIVIFDQFDKRRRADLAHRKTSLWRTRVAGNPQVLFLPEDFVDTLPDKTTGA
jgi:hypothetical protein